MDPGYYVPLTNYAIKRLNQIWPYMGSISELPTLPAKLTRGSKKTTEHSDSEEQSSEESNEFGFSSNFSPNFIDSVIGFGYFPMALRVSRKPDLFVVGVKCHEQRAFINLEEGFHVGKTTKRRARDYFFGLDINYKEALTLCHARHGDNWLCPPLRKAFVEMNQNQSKFQAKLHSIELRTKEGKLVAAELGYSLGSIYTSQTGAYDRSFNGAGTVQLCVLGRVLQQCGFKIWDFGMSMQYKEDLGCVTTSRSEWLEMVKKYKDDTCSLTFPNSNAQEILKQPLPGDVEDKPPQDTNKSNKKPRKNPEQES